MLFKLYYGEEGYVYITEEEYEPMRQVFNHFGISYEIALVEEKMYRITWYDYIDEEWKDIWCTKDDYPNMLKEVMFAQVEYTVREYN